MSQCTYVVPTPSPNLGPWQTLGSVGKTAIHSFAPATCGQGLLETPLAAPPKY